MKGLLIKDYFLLFQRKQTILIFLLLSVFMGYATDGSFIIGYMTILGAIFAIGTISYDDADNGLMFILTLPIEKKTYAAEKYLFSFLVCVGMMIASFVVALIMGAVKSEPIAIGDAAATAIAILPVSIIVLDIMIPIQLRFGAEKGRIALIIIAAVVFASVTLVSQHIIGDVNVDNAVSSIDSLPDAAVAGVLVLVCAVATVISVRISGKVMEKKTF